jgi:hypothetical protein
VVGYALAAMATVGVAVPADSWRPLVVAATAASAALLVIGLSPWLLLGIAIDLVLVVVAITGAWSPGQVAI